MGEHLVQVLVVRRREEVVCHAAVVIPVEGVPGGHIDAVAPARGELVAQLFFDVGGGDELAVGQFQIRGIEIVVGR